ncbi:N/A [soil metagenome]
MISIDVLLNWGGAYKNVSCKEMIFNEGGNCQYYFQLVQGKVRWVNINEEGKEFIQTIIEAGECFGELPLFDDAPYAASAIADEDSIIIRLPKEKFIELLKAEPEIHFQFTKQLTQRLRFKFLLLKELSNHNPEKSISTLLGYFKNTNKNVCSESNRVNLTRQQIADMTGMRVETVIRAIRNLHDKGHLTINKGKVYC